MQIDSFNKNASRIISVSRRTDIPSFYSDWFINRIREGFVVTRNPYNSNQVKRISLHSDDVSAIIFWTRDALPLFPYLDEIDSRGLSYVFLWTITGYKTPLEKHSLSLDMAIESFQKTAAHIGIERMALRYDPIIITNEYTPLWHLHNFSNISTKLKDYANRIIISLMTEYCTSISRMKRAGLAFLEKPLEHEEVCNMLREFYRIAEKNQQTIQACCQNGILEEFGIPDGACIDSRWLTDIFNTKFIQQKDSGQRANCLCAKSIDIGAYDSCPRGCLYCYAVKSIPRSARFANEFHTKSEGLFIGT